jgi:hypothetical protein
MRPLLLSLITKNAEGQLPTQLYENTIIFLYNYYVCYNIIGEENSNRLTNIVNKYAAKINRDCSKDIITMFVEELRKKLPSESMFINAFSNVGWSNHPSIYEGEKNKIRVQTVLEVYERYINSGHCTEDFTIEHMLPDSQDTANGQIGNLIPLEESLNRRCEDKDLKDKLVIYKDSQYLTARKISNRYLIQSFDPQKRTAFMAKEFYRHILNL